MQFLIKIEVFHTIIDDKRFAQAQKEAHGQVERVLQSKNVIASGAFLNQRGGFLFVEADSGDELMRMLEPGLVDNTKVEVFPCVPWEKEGEFLSEFWADLARRGAEA